MLGERVKEFRKIYNMSQKDLAAKTNLSVSYIQQIENNKKTNPSIETITSLANALNVDAFKLIGNGANSELYDNILLNDIHTELSKLIKSENEDVFMIGDIIGKILTNINLDIEYPQVQKRDDKILSILNLLLSIESITRVEPFLLDSYFAHICDITDFIEYKMHQITNKG